METLIIFIPAFAALVLAFFPKGSDEWIRLGTLVATLAVFVLLLLGVLPTTFQFDVGAEAMQRVQNVPWIPSFDIFYFIGVDGISFPLVLLTGLISLLAMGASWTITKHVKAYCILFLLLETGMLGVFMALDFFLFYVFWEVMLLPMYFLIGVWGGPRKEYAAIKFFLYTLFGSVLMLIAILMLYFSSDVRHLAQMVFEQDGGKTLSNLNLHPSVLEQAGLSSTKVEQDRQHAGLAFLRVGRETSQPLNIRFSNTSDGTTLAAYEPATQTVQIDLAAGSATAAEVVNAIQAGAGLEQVIKAQCAPGSDGSGNVVEDDSLTLAPCAEKVHTFNLLALAAIGQRTDLFDSALLGMPLQKWAFLLLFIGFIIKVPSVPLHTWLPDAHVEAPTPISMILAGVLLKMGGYGIIRICYPICPLGGYDFAFLVCLIGVVSMVYGAFAAMAQTDFKRLVAYSSVSHMGYVVLGLGVWSANAGTFYNPDYWNMGVKGAMFQMIAHGISSAGMFFLVGVVYDRVHHRNLNEFGGLFGKMPVYTGLAIGIFFAGLGLPGLCGFIGEVLVVLSVWEYSQVLAVISAAVVILTAAYILWTLQRVYLGAEYKGPHEEALTPITLRELSVAVPLFVLAILLGVLPHHTMLRYMDSTIDRQVQTLADWTRDVKQPALNKMLESNQPADEPSAVSRPPLDSAVPENTHAVHYSTLETPVDSAEEVNRSPITRDYLAPEMRRD